PDDAAAAVAAAKRAFREWSARSAHERAALLRKAAERMIAAADELARIACAEMGKPVREAAGEVRYAAGFLEWYAEEAKRVYGETIPAAATQKRHLVLRQPVGVVAAITPWNFPLAMVTRKLGPALAAGCTVVLKPAEQSPLSAVRLCELFAEVGIPPGTVNLITSSQPAPIGEALLFHPDVQKVTFTGSTEVGKVLLRQAADQVKRVSMELGGHAPFIIFADADLDQAVQGVIASKFRNAGQTCICANRIYVEAPVREAFAERLVAKVKALRVGPGSDPATEIGPLVDRSALEKVERHVADALAHGARLLTGGRRLSDGPLAAGNFYEPTVLDGVTPEMLVCREETFGPVAPLISFRTEEEVLAAANATRYGLAAYFYTRDLSRAVRMMEGLEYGVIGCNDGLPSVPYAPFGGFKESGIGREGGRHGIEAFLEVKYVSIGI
ncbi:MAG TPA: NAD-dependent succinate-semialdehyde dehydrogenase, partial [Limnochordia bacterium]